MIPRLKTKVTQLCTVSILLTVLLTGSVFAANTSDFRCVIDPEHDSASTISMQDARMYLPSAADLSRIVFQFPASDATLTSSSGSVTIRSLEPCDIHSLWSEQDLSNGFCSCSLSYGDTTTEFTMYRTEGIASLYITSADGEKDRAWVEQSKENKAKDNGILLLDENGSVVYDGTMKNLKGRGNSTWDYPKKPYQIKLSEAVDLIQTGDPAEKETTWVLLANYCDPTSSHNAFTYQLGQQIGLSYTPHSRPVDLYYDGEYRGLYQLCEKTEVGTGRVAVHDLESDLLTASGVEDPEGLASVPGVTEQGLTCHYVEGLTLPADYSGGYLLEMDYENRAEAERSWFKTSHGQSIVCKSPENLPLEGVSYISDLYQHFEDAVFNGGTHPVTGADYTQYIDISSLAKCYCILELSQDCDAFLSSTYFYKPDGVEMLYAGPLWDFDSAYGSSAYSARIQKIQAGDASLGRALLGIPSFRAAVAAEYQTISKQITDTALSPSASRRDTALQTICYDEALLFYSRQMDSVLWPDTLEDGTFQDSMQAFRTFLSQRNAFLDELTSSWKGDGGTYFSDLLDWHWDAVRYCQQNGLLNGMGNGQFHPSTDVTRGMLATVLYRMAGEPAVDPAENPYTDVAADRWYTNAILWAHQNGIVKGVDATHFHPNDPVLRQDLAVMLWRYQGEESPKDPTVQYDEVASYAQEAFAWAVESGLLTGDSERGLMPRDNTTRAQLAVILYRLLN